MQKVPFNGENLIWVDAEFTGLEVDARILEIAVVVTPPIMKLLAIPNIEQCLQDHVDSLDFAIFQPASILASMGAWNREHHQKSGLLDRVRSSKITTAMAEQQVLQFLREHLPAGKSPMCGNSIHKDREMLKRWMPAVDRFCHFRNIDASAFDESLKRQGRNDLRMKKEGAHTALSDTLESIKEYIHYQRMLASV